MLTFDTRKFVLIQECARIASSDSARSSWSMITNGGGECPKTSFRWSIAAEARFAGPGAIKSMFQDTILSKVREPRYFPPDAGLEVCQRGLWRECVWIQDPAPITRLFLKFLGAGQGFRRGPRFSLKRAGRC